MLKFQFLYQILPKYLLYKLNKLVIVFQCQSWCSFQRMSSHSSIFLLKFINFRCQLSYSSWILCPGISCCSAYTLVIWHPLREFSLRLFLNISYHKLRTRYENIWNLLYKDYWFKYFIYICCNVFLLFYVWLPLFSFLKTFLFLIAPEKKKITIQASGTFNSKMFLGIPYLIQI